MFIKIEKYPKNLINRKKSSLKLLGQFEPKFGCMVQSCQLYVGIVYAASKMTTIIKNREIPQKIVKNIFSQTAWAI